MVRIRPEGALHEGVREEVARRINCGTYPPDATLPSISALAAEFQVSAITVKRALRDLQTVGLLRSVPGFATIVRRQQRFIRDLDTAFGSSENARHVGSRASIRLLAVGHRKIDDPAFEIFAPPGGYVLNVERVVLIDGVPLTYDSVFLTMAADDALIEALGTTFTYELLRDRGVPVKRTRMIIDAAPASPEVQNVFSVSNGYPTLRRIYQHITADPAVAVYGMSAAPFDRLACTVELRPPLMRARRATRSRAPDSGLKRGVEKDEPAFPLP
jgi:DNA-binding GntR family transcriptional regulator